MKKMLFLGLSLIIGMPYTTYSVDRTAQSLLLLGGVAIGSYAIHRWYNQPTPEPIEKTADSSSNTSSPEQQDSQDKNENDNNNHDLTIFQLEELRNQQFYELQQQEAQKKAEEIAQHLISNQQPLLTTERPTEELQSKTQIQPNSTEQIKAEKENRAQYLSSQFLQELEQRGWE